MSNNPTNRSEPIIACNPNALTPVQRERWMELGQQVYGAFQEIQELPDGYAFRLPLSAEMLLLVAEDLNMERLCCPFVQYTLEILPNGGDLWFRWTGGEGVKEFLRMSFESANLIDEHVAKAAGFSISNRAELTSVDATIEVVNNVNTRFAGALNSSDK